MPDVSIKKRLLGISMSMLLMLIPVGASAAELLPPPPTGTTSGGTTTTSGGLTPLIQSAPRQFSTQILKPMEPNITPMHTVTKGKLPPFNDYASAETFAGNPANSCTNIPNADVCAVMARVPNIGSTSITMPICPITHVPVVSFGSRVTSPSGIVYYSTAHTATQVTSAQYYYYASNYYYCSVNYGDNLSGTVYSPYWDSYYGLPGLYAGFTGDYNGRYMYVTGTSYGSYQSACHTQPHVPADCGNGWVAGFHTHRTYYLVYYAYGFSCSRNAGYYPYVSSPYPFASYNAAISPIGTASTTTICGKAYNTFTRKPS